MILPSQLLLGPGTTAGFGAFLFFFKFLVLVSYTWVSCEPTHHQTSPWFAWLYFFAPTLHNYVKNTFLFLGLQFSLYPIQAVDADYREDPEIL